MTSWVSGHGRAGKAVMDTIEHEIPDPNEDDQQIYIQAMVWLLEHAAPYEAGPGEDFGPEPVC